MNGRRFDLLTKTFTRENVSRRKALLGLSGVAATGLSGFGLGRVAAQDSTPVASPTVTDAADRTFFLFVQTFSSGMLTAHPTEADTYSLTLIGGQAETIYFSDRPERIVGTVPTAQFLENLGFSPDNPPNAALVAQTDQGEDIVVLELLNPVYTEGFGPDGAVTLTYDVRILANYAEEGLAHLAARQDDAMLPESFGAASLFIDDCPDVNSCYRLGGYVGPLPGAPIHTCWSWSDVLCIPCDGQSLEYYYDICNETYQGECDGACEILPA